MLFLYQLIKHYNMHVFNFVEYFVCMFYNQTGDFLIKLTYLKTTIITKLLTNNV